MEIDRYIDFGVIKLKLVVRKIKIIKAALLFERVRSEEVLGLVDVVGLSASHLLLQV